MFRAHHLSLHCLLDEAGTTIFSHLELRSSDYVQATVFWHRCRNLEPSNLNHRFVKFTVSAVRKNRRELPFRRAPITQQILSEIYAHLHIISPKMRQVLWTTCLVAFLSLLCSSVFVVDLKKRRAHYPIFRRHYRPFQHQAESTRAENELVPRRVHRFSIVGTQVKPTFMRCPRRYAHAHQRRPRGRTIVFPSQKP